MRGIAATICIVVSLAFASPLRADDDAKLRAIITKAIKAHGGADNLKKLKASVSKSKGKFYGMGEGIDFTSETSVQLPDRIRIEVVGEFGGQKFKFMQIFNDGKGWVELGNLDEMNKDQLAETKERMNVETISHLVTLADKDYKLSALGETKVGGREAVGVRVERKGFRNVSLFFDKAKGLILKIETRGMDPMGGGVEFTAETFPDDYKKVDGLMIAHKVLIKHDNKKFVEAEVTEVKVSEKLDDKIFAKPE
jgi:hypothetical protein